MIPNPVENIVYGRSDTRLRATWRVLLAIGTLLLLPQILAGIIISPFGDLQGNHLLFGMMVIIGLGIFLIGFVGFGRYIDRRPLRAYGLTFSRSWWADGIVGFVAPMIGMSVAVGAGVMLGWMSIESVTGQSILVVVGWGVFLLLVYHLGGAILEGICYAGIVGQNIAEGVGSYGGTLRASVVTATVVGGILFTIIHFVMYDTAAFGNIPSSGVLTFWFGSGTLMILSYFWTGRVAFAIGVNAGINLMGSWFFLFGDAIPGAPAVILIEHTPPAPFDVIGGTLLLSLILIFAILVVWTDYRTGSVNSSEETVSKPHSIDT